MAPEAGTDALLVHVTVELALTGGEGEIVALVVNDIESETLAINATVLALADATGNTERSLPDDGEGLALSNAAVV